MVPESRSAANSRRRRRRRQRRRRVALAGGSALVIAALVLLAFMFPPSFLSSPSEKPKPSSRSGEPVPAVVDEPLARLAIAGDTGERNAAVEATAKSMQIESERQGEPYDALVITGDMIYPDGDADLTDASITEPFARVLEEAVLVPVLGNHDVQSGEGREIMSRLGRDTDWYVQKIGPVRLIVLNSNRVGDKRQMAWLRGVLAEKQPADTWTMVALHHPAYSAGEHGSAMNVRRRWVPLFEDANIPLVFAGHDHDYQRSTPQNGITHVVTGGGSKLREAGREDFTAVSASVFHYVDLLVYKNRLEGRAIDHDGELVDSFTIRR
jgi:3',5'-cyclic AMP phosphodiesterase CpdA